MTSTHGLSLWRCSSQQGPGWRAVRALCGNLVLGAHRESLSSRVGSMGVRGGEQGFPTTLQDNQPYHGPRPKELGKARSPGPSSLGKKVCPATPCPPPSSPRLLGPLCLPFGHQAPQAGAALSLEPGARVRTLYL